MDRAVVEILMLKPRSCVIIYFEGRPECETSIAPRDKSISYRYRILILNCLQTCWKVEVLNHPNPFPRREIRHVCIVDSIRERQFWLDVKNLLVVCGDATAVVNVFVLDAHANVEKDILTIDVGDDVA